MSQAVAIQNETFVNLLQAESRYIKDVKINVGNALENNQHLTRKEALPLRQKGHLYCPAGGIKMTVMAAPALGKEFFELLSLVISSVNGCELCVTSHEQSVLQHGCSETRVLEAVRLGAVIRGLIMVLSLIP
jgi:AhpD family alkylhydroperoxidase